MCLFPTGGIGEVEDQVLIWSSSVALTFRLWYCEFEHPCYWKGGENSPATDIQLSFILEKELDYSPICWDWYVVTRLTIQQVSCLITKSFWMLAVTCYVFFGFFCHFCLVFMKMFYCIPVLMQLKIYRTVFT